MIKVRNVNFGYKKDKYFLKNINLDIECGKITLLTGPNGSGKTTLLKNIYGALIPNEGEVFLDDEKISFADLSKYHRSVAYVGHTLFAYNYSIWDNKELFKNLYEDFNEDLFDEMIMKLKLENRIDSKVSLLADGQLIKSEIAFAVATNPDYILFDGKIDDISDDSTKNIIEVLKEIVERKNIGVLFAVANIADMVDIADYVLLLDDGEIVEKREVK